jgi:hypothetical protein
VGFEGCFTRVTQSKLRCAAKNKDNNSQYGRLYAAFADALIMPA